MCRIERSGNSSHLTGSVSICCVFVPHVHIAIKIAMHIAMHQWRMPRPPPIAIGDVAAAQALLLCR